MTDSTSKTVLITGATGYIGRRLTHRLLDAGDCRVRLLVRNRNKVQVAIAGQVDIREGSTFDDASLTAALEGVDCAFYLIHSMGEGDDYRRLDRESAENFRRACIAAGVRRIVYLGGLGRKESASTHLLSRIETGEVLSAEPEKVQTIWLRAGVIIGSGSASFEIIRNLAQKLPLMITPRWVRTRTQPIAIADVLSYLQHSVDLEVAGNLVVDIGGEALRFQDMIVQAGAAMGLKRVILPVPFLSPRLSSYWLIFFTPVPYSIASALVEGLKSETILQNDHAARYYPQIRPLNFTQAVAAAELDLAHNQVVSRWCDSSALRVCDIRDYDDPAGAVMRDVRVVPFVRGEKQQDVFAQRLPARRPIRLVQVYRSLASARPDGQSGRRLRSQPRPTGTRQPAGRRRDRFLEGRRYPRRQTTVALRPDEGAGPGLARIRCPAAATGPDRPFPAPRSVRPAVLVFRAAAAQPGLSGPG